jgi:hypothetical protein
MKKQTKHFQPKDRFINLNVYQFPLGNCGGITDNLDTESIYIPCDTGNTNFEDIDNPELIFIPEQKSSDYFALIPLFQPTGLVGPMNGGNLAYTSDSRSRKIYHIHDRWETQEQYKSFSR